jgi:hypothetical protein
MTISKERVIELAREAGYQHDEAMGPCEDCERFDLERFAQAIRNEALEEAAKQCEYVGPQGNPMAMINAAFAQEIRNLKEQQ